MDKDIIDFNAINISVTGELYINPDGVFNLEGEQINIGVSDQHIGDVAQNKIN